MGAFSMKREAGNLKSLFRPLTVLFEFVSYYFVFVNAETELCCAEYNQ
jgi:hypothetical protein